MYDVLIVDDEYYICEGLVSSIRKLNLPQIGQIRTCFCGEEALSLCKTYKPQIVFTDIKMKEMNGIELIHALGRILHPVQFFILSGYDDFEYVRGAFQKGAADYLLKPILNEDLKKAVTTACANLQNQAPVPEKKRSDSFHFSHEVFSKLPFLHSASQEKAFLEDLASIGITDDCVFALLASSSPQPQDRLIKQINTIYDELEESGTVVCNAISESKIAVIAAAPSGQKLQALLLLLVRPEAEPSGTACWAAAVSDPNPAASISRLYTETEELLCCRLKQGYGLLFTRRDYARKGRGIPEKLKHQVSAMIQSPHLILNEIQRISFNKEIRKMALPDLKNFYLYFNEMLQIAFINNHLEQLPLAPDLYDLSCYEELENFLYNRLNQYASLLPSHPQSVNLIYVIRDYVDSHFSENLSLSDLADRFFISYSYLSKAFSKTFDMSFQEYLRLIRMEHAMELLHRPELSIQQIASQVGYDNAFNFSRAFKNQYGVSPTHFRNQPPG